MHISFVLYRRIEMIYFQPSSHNKGLGLQFLLNPYILPHIHASTHIHCFELSQKIVSFSYLFLYSLFLFLPSFLSHSIASSDSLSLSISSMCISLSSSLHSLTICSRTLDFRIYPCIIHISDFPLSPKTYPIFQLPLPFK